MEHTDKNINKAQQAVPKPQGTIGMGSTTSAFADEKSKNTIQQKSPGTYYEDEQKNLGSLARFDTWAQDLGKTTGAGNYKTTLGMAEKLLPTIYKDLNSGNFNNTARAITMLSTALIPYGGAFISPIIGILWPENGPNIKEMLQEMENKLVGIMDEKIEAKDLDDLEAAVKGLMVTLKEFENSLNGNIGGEYYSAPADVDSLNRGRITAIQKGFNDLISAASKPKFKIAELPIYTIIATAHLNFLHTVKKQGTSPKINYTEAALKDLLQNMEKNHKEYTDYIEKTYKEGEARIDSKLEDKQQIEKELNKVHEQLSALGPKPKNHTHIEENKFINKKEELYEQARSLKERLSKYNELMYQKSDFYSKTKGSAAFQIASTGKTTANPSWVKTEGSWVHNGFWYYIDAKGQKKTGWFNDKALDGKDRWYYLSTGTTGLDSVRGNSLLPKGTMLTGWFHDTRKNKWYYLSPEKDLKNSAGELFNHGQMMTKWVEIKDTQTSEPHWYYFNPDDGSMTHDKKAVKIGNLKYDFDSNGVCTTPNGY
ncbi:insecticidal delta-endotoxin Cry8Ea1 family protein [Bacillus cereus]|uniref:insecticidal delta-endotoxin Cry8Ea1 family protein n=1 Tax=Bacillus cereus group sp. MYBK34-1 TaxID=3450631 RepID=UPI003F78CEA7|nr:insecticidal delta-endotoxin Cry8Ea1 family protein [Bacillus cereus]